MKMKKHGFVALILSLYASGSLAYKPITHEQLSSIAVDQSVLVGGIYGTALADIGAPPYSARAYTALDGKGNLTVNALIARGADDEDTELRFFNHFFNPQFNNFEGRGLYGIFDLSPDWAIEDKGERNLIAESFEDQNFSYLEARRYFKGAMMNSYPESRLANMSLMFESLGHVIHHVQDMAQPQHTRSDPHIPFGNIVLNEFAETLGLQPADASVYEGFTHDEYPTKALLENLIASSPHIFQMQIPELPTIRHYWHTPGAVTDIRRGMAEFASQNYVSSGSLFKTSFWPWGPLSYSSSSQLKVPLPNGSSSSWLENEYGTRIALSDGSQAIGETRYIVGHVRDDYNNHTYQNQKLATVSLVLDTSDFVPLHRLITINSMVYRDMHKVLIPRAVKFSAGVINHFFKGSLDVARTPNKSNSWQVTNKSGETMDGAFILLFESDSRLRSRYAAKTATLVAGDSVEIVAPEPPELSTTKVVVVFEGSLGAEQSFPGGIAGARVKDFPAPPPSVACGTTISQSGSSEGLSIPSFELGSTPGDVQLEFQAFYIPDSITLRANNAQQTLLATSNGLTSGYHLYSINYDPASLGTTTVNLSVIGNIDTDTRWVATLGCPGQILDTPDRDVPIVPVTFEYGGSDNGFAIGTCTFELFIDGQRQRVVYAGASGTTFTLNLSAGTHQFDYVNKSCDQRRPTGGFRSNFSDSTGKHPIANPYYSSTISGLFTVAVP